jgi:Golgi phosphoprotein 3
MKIGYQLKQVRERLAKGLVDKGILRTEKRNFLLFDMATHPVVDSGAKEEIRRRVRNVLTQRTVVLNNSQWLPENLEFRYVRTVAMVCAAYAANVLENALSTLGHEAREKAFNQTDELLADYSQWPFGRKATGNDIGENLPQVIAEVSIPSLGPLLSPQSLTNLSLQEINKSPEKELQLEVVAACLNVFTRLDSLL